MADLSEIYEAIGYLRASVDAQNGKLDSINTRLASVETWANDYRGVKKLGVAFWSISVAAAGAVGYVVQMLGGWMHKT